MIKKIIFFVVIFTLSFALVIFFSRLILQYNVLNDSTEKVFSTRGYVRGIENPLILSFVAPKEYRKISAVVRVRSFSLVEHGVMNTLNECKVHLYQGSKIISELVGVDFNLKTRFMGDPNKRDLIHVEHQLEPGEVYSVHLISNGSEGNVAIDVVLRN